jgi:hypothetical protein
MDQAKLGALVYAEGFIENYLEHLDARHVDPDENEDTEVIKQWEILTTRLKELRQELLAAETKLSLARGAIL